MNSENLQQHLYQFQINILYQKILHAGVFDLLQICMDLAEENPFLEFEKYSEDISLSGQMFENISTNETLTDGLKMQIAYMYLEPAVSKVANFIAELIDRDGYLRFSVDEICDMTKNDTAIVNKALDAIQSLEPPGIGARNYQECFILQMKAKKMEETLAFKVVSKYGKELLAGRFSYIKNKMKLKDTELSSVIADIGKLDPFPARSLINTHKITPIFPDFIIKSIDPNFSMEFGEDKIFRVFVNEGYAEFLKKRTTSIRDRNFLNEKLRQARKFLMYIENRKIFLGKLIGHIVGYQKEFILGKGSLRPLSEKDLAEKFSCSCSLISRAVSNKFIVVARDVFPVKKLFSRSTGDLSQDLIIDEI
ncbi:MAG: hypothetical protein NC907_01965, partial [Candidatus Omnitrophica bacterium]|nr:hypothetical protein [Candidatus Omnitrophota bacterium]